MKVPSRLLLAVAVVSLLGSSGCESITDRVEARVKQPVISRIAEAPVRETYEAAQRAVVSMGLSLVRTSIAEGSIEAVSRVHNEPTYRTARQLVLHIKVEDMPIKGGTQVSIWGREVSEESGGGDTTTTDRALLDAGGADGFFTALERELGKAVFVAR